MPTLTGVTYRTVTGSYLRFTGGPAGGSVMFLPSVRIVTDNGDIVVPYPIEVTLDGDGAFSVSLPVNDDPQTSPTGWTWLVVERIDGDERSWSFELENGDGTPVDLSEVAPTDPVSPATTYVLASEAGGGGTPDAHASTHENGGSDELALDASQITTGTLDDARIPAAIARDAEVTAAITAAVSAAVTALVNGAPSTGDTLGELHARLAVIEALGSLATDAELIAAVAALLGSADADGDTLGELQALIGLRLLKSQNLADLPNASTALTNLGVSAFIKTLLDDANAAAARTTLGVDTAGLTSLLNGTFQPLDSDLTAIAALSTTAYGRGLLALADATALRSSAGLVLGTDIYSKAAVDAGFQPLDSDLTAIAALTTTAYGRSLLEAANAGAARTLLGLVIGTDVQAYDADLTTWAGLTPSANAQSLVTAANYAAMRTLLGLVPGTDVQAYDAELAAIAGLTSAANKLPYFTGSGTAALADLTAAGRALLDDADAAAQLTTLGVSAFIQTLLDDANAAAALATLGAAASARTITAGSGLSGGGDLSADRTIDLNVDGSTLEISSDTARVKDAGITPAKLATAPKTRTLVFAMGTVTTGAKKAYLRVPWACTIVRWTLIGDVSGSAVVDVWKDTTANFPPTNADSITASDKPTLTAAQIATSTSLTGWTTSLSVGDYLEVEIESASTVTTLKLDLEVVLS